MRYTARQMRAPQDESIRASETTRREETNHGDGPYVWGPSSCEGHEHGETMRMEAM
jgi:hypothetical protein